ncbi:S-layer protein [Microcoleus sp. B5-D4]|uniref:S-layer protein n=1 Tax=unclassified Microcoleus TaxID=2642155 RepID=UPI002FD39B4B
MKVTIFAAAILLISASFSAPANAQNTEPLKPNTSLVQVQQTREQILNACVQNQAETLPNPFSDVPSNHWAYKAVLTMYYCGPYREGMNPALIKESLEPGDTTRESLPSPALYPFPLPRF